MEKEILTLALFACHWLGDYTHLTTSWMLKAKRIGKPFHPILCHAGVHAILMSFMLFFFGVDLPMVVSLFCVQLFSHFAIDVWKGKMNVWFPALQSPTNQWHWCLFGLDQLLHLSVIIFMVYNAVSAGAV